ncbi:hypothetical protein [Nevskia sp.]|uniref:hypothetical protein n=1 Tax=Nevskia sp. TaxID=1929292 RepID=UPI0025EDF439|nr:hypothetical protein [Nevskia sp.]
MQHSFKPNVFRVAVTAAFGVAAAVAATSVSAQTRDQGRYVVGDFHNHTTCSDGQISVQKLVNKSVDTYGLDWFILAGHGGGGTRNCTLADDETVFTPSSNPFVPGQGPSTTWADSIGIGRVKGDRAAEGYMFRWQSTQEFEYPLLEAMAEAKQKPIFIGLESVVAGHEHSDTAVIAGQLPASGRGNADPGAQWEYCFDRADTDLSRGADNQWDCTVPGGARNEFLDARGRKLTGAQDSGTLGHLKTVEGVRWLQAKYPTSSYYIPAHLERAGVFNPAGSNGFNIEHLRNFNNAGPTVAFGFEGGPGHQASSNRSYGAGATGGGTYGGAGYYTGKLGGVWDALLGEGRNWWIFNNSDYHSRGSFGPDDVRSTSDQYPGEFNRSHVLAKTGGKPLTPQAVVDGMRSGNAYYVNGDLIDRLAFVACRATGGNDRDIKLAQAAVLRAATLNEGFADSRCAQQGEKLVINAGEDVVIFAALRDPEGANLSPYTIPNPSLLQVGINQPLNMPVLDHVDLISGLVTGYISPDSPLYAGAAPGGVGGAQDSPNATNPSTAVRATFSAANWSATPGGYKLITLRAPKVKASQYIRLRGSNIPAAVPNETDAAGNPLVDTLANNITVTPDAVACADPTAAAANVNCLTHLPVQGAGRRLDVDVEAFTDLWFYSNPIYVEVRGGTVVAGVK